MICLAIHNKICCRKNLKIFCRISSSKKSKGRLDTKDDNTEEIFEGHSKGREKNKQNKFLVAKETAFYNELDQNYEIEDDSDTGFTNVDEKQSMCKI